MEDVKILATVVDSDPWFADKKKAILSAEWRCDLACTHQEVVADAWYGALAENEVMYLERSNDAFGNCTARGVAAERVNGQLHLTPLPDIFARYIIALVETRPENVYPFVGTPPIKTPVWAPQFFLMERLPGVTSLYNWSGATLQNGFRLVGHNKKSPEHHLRIDHDTSKPLDEGTQVYLGRGAGERLLSFPVSERLVQAAVDIWKSQHAEESN